MAKQEVFILTKFFLKQLFIFLLLMPVLLPSAFAQSHSSLPFKSEANIKVFLSPGGIIKINAPIFYSEVKKHGNSFLADTIEMEVSQMDSGLLMRDNKIKDILGLANKIVAFDIKGKKEQRKNKGKFKLRLNNVEKELPLSFILLGDNKLKAAFTIKLSDFNIERPEYLGAKVRDNVKVTAVLKYFVHSAQFIPNRINGPSK